MVALELATIDNRKLPILMEESPSLETQSMKS